MVLHHVGCEGEPEDEEKQKSVVEVFLNEVEVVLWRHAGVEDIKAVHENLSGRLKSGWECLNFLQTYERKSIGEVLRSD